MLSSEGMEHEVYIVNTPNLHEIAQQCNALNPDIAHIMYDDHISIASSLKAPKILYTSHFAYLTNPQLETHHRGYFSTIC